MKVASALVCVLLAGCAYIGELTGARPSVVAALEVHNRTELAITYVAADGERMEVPACGQASDPDFRIDTVKVGANDWYVRAFGVGSDLAGKPSTSSRSPMPAPPAFPSSGRFLSRSRRAAAIPSTSMASRCRSDPGTGWVSLLR